MMFDITFSNAVMNKSKSFANVKVIHVHLPNEKIVDYFDAESLIIDNPSANGYVIERQNGQSVLNRDWYPASN